MSGGQIVILGLMCMFGPVIMMIMKYPGKSALEEFIKNSTLDKIMMVQAMTISGICFVWIGLCLMVK